MEGLETYTFSHFSGKPLSELGFIDWGSLHKEDGSIVIVPYTSWGDYYGSTAERSNQAYLEKEWDWAYVVRGDYGSRAIAVDLSSITTEQQDELDDVIRSLNDYPVLDDDLLSEVEMELEQEDWDSWIEKDIRRELDRIDFDNDDLTQEDMQQAARENNIYWEAESAVGGHIDIDAIVEALR